MCDFSPADTVLMNVFAFFFRCFRCRAGGQACAAARVSDFPAAPAAALGCGLALLPRPPQEPVRHPHALAAGNVVSDVCMYVPSNAPP